MNTTTTDANLLEWIAAAKVERRAYRAWLHALPLAPIKPGWKRETGSVWQGYVDRLRAEHDAARDALDALSR